MNNINGIGPVYNNGDKRQNPTVVAQEKPEAKVEEKPAEINLEGTASCVYGKALVNKAAKPDWADSVNASIKAFQENPAKAEAFNENVEAALEAGLTLEQACVLSGIKFAD